MTEPGTFPALILEEITNPEYAGLVHGTQSVYEKGCRGPFCRKEHRERKRRQYAARAAAEGREVRPYRPQMNRLIDPLLEQFYQEYAALLVHRALEAGVSDDPNAA